MGKKVFLETISQKEGIADMEIGYQLIEIGLLVSRALTQDRRVGLVTRAKPASSTLPVFHVGHRLGLS